MVWGMVLGVPLTVAVVVGVDTMVKRAFTPPAIVASSLSTAYTPEEQHIWDVARAHAIDVEYSLTSHPAWYAYIRDCMIIVNPFEIGGRGTYARQFTMYHELGHALDRWHTMEGQSTQEGQVFADRVAYLVLNKVDDPDRVGSLTFPGEVREVATVIAAAMMGEPASKPWCMLDKGDGE